MNTLTIQSISARAVLTPLKRMLRTASGSIDQAPLVLLDVVTNEGIIGRSYLFGYTAMTLKPLLSLVEQVKGELIGKQVVPVDRLKQLQDRYRLLGTHGLLGMLISSLDMAYWDILGKAANAPVVKLLGGEARPLQAYDSYGMLDPVEDRGAIQKSLDQGFKAIKIKIGFPDVKQDIHVVREVRAMIGPDVALMVDYNQSLTPDEAISRIRKIEEFDLAWVEEPVPAEDLQGHARIKSIVDVNIQTGENWWFPRGAQQALQAESCDLMMPDLMKIGGITGWLSVMGLAQAHSIPMSSHIFIEPSAHVLAVTPTFDYLEFMDFTADILAEPNQVVNGAVTPKGPGIGLEWDESAVSHYLIDL